MILNYNILFLVKFSYRYFKLKKTFDFHQSIWIHLIIASYCTSIVVWAFFKEFSYIIHNLRSLYLHQTFEDFFLTNTQILVCQHGKYDCRLWKVYFLMLFLGNFHILGVFMLIGWNRSSFFNMKYLNKIYSGRNNSKFLLQ